MVKGTVKVKREPPSKPEPMAKKIKKEPVAVKAPQRYVYLVFETFDRNGMYHGDSEHTAKVCAVYENEADARTHADALGGEEEDDDDNQMRYGGDEKHSAIVVRAPVLAGLRDPKAGPRFSAQEVCKYEVQGF